jgi:hypothetical protein
MVEVGGIEPPTRVVAQGLTGHCDQIVTLLSLETAPFHIPAGWESRWIALDSLSEQPSFKASGYFSVMPVLYTYFSKSIFLLCVNSSFLPGCDRASIL